MNPEIPADAREFGDAARKAFEALGGGDYVLRCEEEPAHRDAAAGALSALGIDDIDPRADLDTLAAAAVLCQEAGRVALPYPVVSVLLQTDGVPFAVGTRVHHADLFAEWRIASVPNWGAHMSSSDTTQPQFGRLGRFVGDLTPGDEVGDAAGDALLWLTLTSWQILGTTERAVELASDHVSNRIQFGKPIATFQAVQFMLADAAVAVAGLRELALFTLWRVASDIDNASPDVLALRVHAIDVARAVLRTCQQLHGASGVCDEYDISVITRHIQPALRLPFGAERSAAMLADAIARHGFVGLFPHGGAHA
jgi:hypothetical protein